MTKIKINELMMVIKHGSRFFDIPPTDRCQHALALNLDMLVTASFKRLGYMECSVTSKISDKRLCLFAGICIFES